MKTVSGKLVSSHPMSLSRAAKYLSTFTSSPNEASPAFVAYLRRTSHAFNQLVHLHKHCNIPAIGEDDNHDDVLTHVTATSVAIVGKGKSKTRDDVNVDDHSRDTQRYDSPSVGMDLKVQDGRRIIEGDGSDVRTDLNKSKKKKKNKKERGGDVTHGDDHDAIKVDDVKTKMTRLDGSEEMSVADVGATAKKSKKNKAKDVQLNSEIKLENKHQVLSEKKQRYEAREGENGRNMETEAVRKKESRKRKHERVADGELEGLQEAVKSKKKKL